LIKPVLSGAEDEVRSAVEGTADWIIEMGPEGGVRGREIVAEGRPEAVAVNALSFAGR
jgi:excinuclease UvrABC ATPase subunit